jgi:hypothetical protein
VRAASPWIAYSSPPISKCTGFSLRCNGQGRQSSSIQPFIHLACPRGRGICPFSPCPSDVLLEISRSDIRICLTFLLAFSRASCKGAGSDERERSAGAYEVTMLLSASPSLLRQIRTFQAIQTETCLRSPDPQFFHEFGHEVHYHIFSGVLFTRTVFWVAGEAARLPYRVYSHIGRREFQALMHEVGSRGRTEEVIVF